VAPDERAQTGIPDKQSAGAVQALLPQGSAVTAAGGGEAAHWLKHRKSGAASKSEKNWRVGDRAGPIVI
jgi:hypothetical protein